MTENLVSDNWTTFQMNVGIGVTIPANKQGSTSVAAVIVSPSNTQTLYSATTLTTQFAVAKPSGATLTFTSLVSFGADPEDTTQKGLGVGLYSNTYCNAENKILDTTGGGAGIVGTLADAAAVNAYTAGPTLAYVGTSNCGPADTAWELDVPNALELNYKTPYKIPNDRTYAEIKCTTEQVTNAASACTAHAFADFAVQKYCTSADAWYWANDPVVIF